MLAVNLPAGAQMWAAAGSDAAWTTGEHLQAAQVDLLAGANWQRGGGKGKRPEPIDRPSDLHKARRREVSTQSRASRFIEKQQQRKPRTIEVQTAPAIPSTTTDRPRDSRGRFVSRKGE